MLESIRQLTLGIQILKQSQIMILFKKYETELLLVLNFLLTTSEAKKTTPVCHNGILKLFNWCEQSNCGKGCQCITKSRVCKQFCSKGYCPALYCSSPITCFQNIITDTWRLTPKLKDMVSHSPLSHQDCSNGHCESVIALRHGTKTRSFQSCTEGYCKNIKSFADTTKQFCGNCKTMSCEGKYSTNCTQLCVLNKCEDVVCRAKRCQQTCLHGSSCNLTCTNDVEACEQKCGEGSTCKMTCNAKSCRQKCGKEGPNCTAERIRYTKPIKTIAATTSSSTIITTLPSSTLSPSSSVSSTYVNCLMLYIFQLLVLLL